jgi:hypothetical protein
VKTGITCPGAIFSYLMKKILFLGFLLHCLLTTEGSCQDPYQQQPVVSGVFWITIHARQPEIYDSLRRLFVEDLGIPQYFDTETYGSSRYFTVLIGNVILEPCGPFPFHQSFGPDIMTRFNTLAFRPFESLDSSIATLQNQGFDITANEKDALLSLTVDELATEFLPVNISKSADWNSRDKIIMDSLHHMLTTKGGGPAGLEYLEEIHLGYRSMEYQDKWKSFLYPMETRGNLWILPKRPNIRFYESEREEIIALVFKVRSLEVAARYLETKGLLGNQTSGTIEIDMGHARGIKLLLTE